MLIVFVAWSLISVHVVQASIETLFRHISVSKYSLPERLYKRAIADSKLLRTCLSADNQRLDVMPRSNSPGYAFSKSSLTEIPVRYTSSCPTGLVNMTSLVTQKTFDDIISKRLPVSDYGVVFVSPASETINKVDSRFQLLQRLFPLTSDIDHCESSFRQLLGLPDNKQYDILVTYEVCPSDIVRPCRVFDDTLSSDACICAKDIVGPTDYVIFFKDYIRTNDFPFTGMGFTFDWGVNVFNKRTKTASVYGVSEFIVKPGVTLNVVANDTILSVCKEYVPGLTWRF